MAGHPHGQHGHGQHGHGHQVADHDWAQALDTLRRADAVEAELNAELAGWLVSGTERLAADLGCGAGGMTLALRRALPTEALLVAVDGPAPLLAAAVEQAGRFGPVEGRPADLGQEVPLAADSADLIWASSVAHHLPDQVDAVRRWAGCLAPGGRLALAEGGLRPRTLPWDTGLGEPGLEVRLDALQDRWVAAMRRGLPRSVSMPHGWAAALTTAGLVDVVSRSFLLDRPPPLSDRDAGFVVQRLRGHLDRADVESELDPSDTDALRRLTDPSDPAYDRLRDELYLLTVRTVHVGRRPA